VIAGLHLPERSCRQPRRSSRAHDGTQRHNDVRRVIAPPYLLYEAAHDSEFDVVSYQRELLALDESGVTDADLTPPSR
jgi:hypothetical protein